MKVKELIAKLQKLDGDRLVIISRDEEGNGFAQLSKDFFVGNYMNHEVGLPKLTKSLEEQGYNESDIIKGKPCVVLYPENFYN